MLKSIAYLQEKGIQFREIHLSEVPKTAQDVERIFGCPLRQVVKSLLFMGREPVLAVLCGDRKVGKQKLAQDVGEESLRMATPEEVLEHTGYPIGGVSPFGLPEGLRAVLDAATIEEEKLNTGSGIAEIGIELTSEELKKAWRGLVADIS